MSRDLRELLHDTAVRPTRQVDPSEVVATAHRRTWAFRAATSLGVVILVVLGAVGVSQMWESPDAPPQITDQPEGEPSTVGELNTAVSSAIDTLAHAAGIEGTQRSYIDGHLGGAVWFDYRSDGDAVVVQQRDVDVVDSGWWLVDDEPPAVGRNITTTIWVVVDDRFYEATLAEDRPSAVWTDQDRVDAPRTLTIGVALIEGRFELRDMLDPFSNGAEVTRGHARDGTTLWWVSEPYEDGHVVQQWDIHPDGHLSAWATELVDVTTRDPLQQGAFPITSGRMEFAPLTDPGPIEPPTPGAAPTLDEFDLPDDFRTRASSASPN